MKYDKDLIANDASTGVAFSAFLGTVALFFTGLLIAQFNSFDLTIRVPILYLIICTFAFIFSATVYANASGIVSRNNNKLADKFIRAGNAISEYLGIYLFVMSIPLVINAVTTDAFLRHSTGFVAILSILLYSISEFSMLNRFISKFAKYLITVIVTLAAIALFLSQIYFVSYFVLLAVLFLASTTIATGYYYHKE